MYLNVYVPLLQTLEGVLGFLKKHRGHKVASTRLVEPITRKFVAAIEQFARADDIPLVCFAKGERPLRPRFDQLDQEVQSCYSKLNSQLENLTHLQQVFAFKISSDS